MTAEQAAGAVNTLGFPMMAKGPEAVAGYLPQLLRGAEGGPLEQLGKAASTQGLVQGGPSGLAQPPMELISGVAPEVTSKLKMSLSVLSRIINDTKQAGLKDEMAEASQMHELATRALMKKNVDPKFVEHLTTRIGSESRDILMKLANTVAKGAKGPTQAAQMLSASATAEDNTVMKLINEVGKSTPDAQKEIYRQANVYADMLKMTPETLKNAITKLTGYKP